MADLRKYNVNDDPMQALRNMLDMQDDEYGVDAVLTEAVTQIEHHRKAETANSIGVQITAEDSRFAEHVEKRQNRIIREHARWLESGENEKRECAATELLDMLMVVVDGYLCNFSIVQDNNGKRESISTLIESLRVQVESHFVNVTGIELDHDDDDAPHPDRRRDEE